MPTGAGRVCYSDPTCIWGVKLRLSFSAAKESSSVQGVLAACYCYAWPQKHRNDVGQIGLVSFFFFTGMYVLTKLAYSAT